MFGEFVEALASMPLWVVAILVVLLVLLLIQLVFMLIRRDRSGEAKPRRRKKVRLPRDIGGMTRACRQFHARMRHAFPGARAHYRLPLFVAVGPSRDAIAHAVRGAGLNQHLGDSLSSGGVTWSAFERAAVAEVDPAVVIDDDGRGDRWGTFIRLLQRFRPQRPVDGVILVLPADELADSDEGYEALVERAEKLRERLAELENQLSMSVPLHCVVANSEAVPGFEELGRVMPPHLLDRPLGYASPYSGREAYRPRMLEDAIDVVRGKVQRLVVESLTTEQGVVDGDALFMLPTGITRLEPGLKAYLDTILQPGQYARLATLRGVYFTGDVVTGQGQSDRRSAFNKHALNERIFPEYTLAEPTGNRWIAANRDVRRAQIGVAVLVGAVVAGLYAQDRILANRVPQMESLVAAVGKDYRRVSISRADGGSAAEMFRDDSVQFIQRMSSLNGDYLRSLFIPSSWFGQLPRDLERLQTGAYIEILFKSLGHALQRRAREVTSDTGGTRGRSADGDGGAPYPNYAPLDQQIKAYARLASHIEHYREIRGGGRDSFALRELTSYLYGIDLPAGFFPEMQLDSLGARDFVLDPIRIQDYQDQARSAFLERFSQFTFDLTSRDQLAARLRTIRDILGERERLFQAENRSFGRLQQLYSQLTRVKSLFEQGRYDWALSQDVLIGPDFDALRTRIRENRLLGDRVAGRLEQRALRTRRQFRRKITEIIVPDFGPLAATSSEGWRLTPAAQGVLARLRSFSRITDGTAAAADTFAAAENSRRERRMPLPAPRGHYIEWRVPALAAGGRVLDDIANRVDGASGSRTVERALGKVVRAEKLDAIVRAVRQAVVETPARRDLVTGGSLESGLRQRVEAFEAARPYLDRFLRVLDDADAGTLRRRLLNIAGWEAEKILLSASEILESDELYAMDRNALSAWEGGRGLAQLVFNVDSGSGLVAYLAQQRARLRTLGQDFARPAMQFLYDHGAAYNPDRLEAFARWRVVLENLQRYDNQTPGNPIQALESFVLQRMPTVTLSDCRVAKPQHDLRGDDYIVRRFKAVTNATYERCLTRKTKEIESSYTELARRFNNDLAGRPPFVPASEMTNGGAISPDGLIRFLDRFDQAMNAGLGDPRFWTQDGRGDSVIDFLDRMDRVAGVLRPAIQPPDSVDAINYAVTPDFRIKRADEVNANHILSWSLTVGDRTRTLFSSDKALSWSPGDPVSLAFKWAKDAPSRPAEATDMAGLSVTDRTARISFDDTWSLISLIAQYGVPANAAEVGGGHVLKFALPISYRGSDDGDARLKGSEARLFVRLRLRADGGSLRLPAFPTRAPRLQITARDGEQEEAR